MLLKNLFNKSWVQFTLLFLVINSLGLLGFFIYLPRSVFYYEYGLVLLALMYFKKPVPAFLFFIFIFIFDLLDTFSGIFLFKTDQFLKILNFAEYYKFSSIQIIIGSIVILFLIIIYKCLQFYQSTIQQNKKHSLQFIVVIYFIVFLIDIFNGSNKLRDERKAWLITNKNIASLLSHNYIYFVSQYLRKDGGNYVKPYTDLSPVFSYLQNDTVSNELVIIVESWGLMSDPRKQENLQKFLQTKITKAGYQSKWGSTYFNGGTTSAGLKQLLNVKGGYHYYLTHQSKKEINQSIFDIKNKQGYQTNAFHSYTGKMFTRAEWWPNIGIQKMYFRDDYLMDFPNRSEKINGESPFPSIKDNLMFDYLLNKTSKDSSKKQFTYFLTVNSHLPFKSITEAQELDALNPIKTYPISEEAQNQLLFIKNILSYFVEHLSNSKYEKIVIVGDHMPPYINIDDRAFYNSKMVPYIYLFK